MIMRADAMPVVKFRHSGLDGDVQTRLFMALNRVIAGCDARANSVTVFLRLCYHDINQLAPYAQFARTR